MTLEKLEELLRRGVLRSVYAYTPNEAFGVELVILTPQTRTHWKTQPCPTLAEAVDLAWQYYMKQQEGACSS